MRCSSITLANDCGAPWYGVFFRSMAPTAAKKGSLATAPGGFSFTGWPTISYIAQDALKTGGRGGAMTSGINCYPVRPPRSLRSSYVRKSPKRNARVQADPERHPQED